MTTTAPQKNTAWKTYQRTERWIWQWCLSRETMFTLLILTAISLLLMWTIPQSPTQARFDVVSYHQWLSTLPQPFRTAEPVLQSLGLFWIEHTFWFRLLLGFLAFDTLVVLIHRGYRLFHPQVQRAESFYLARDAFQLSSTAPRDQVIESVKETILSLTGACISTTAQGHTYMVGNKKRKWATGLSLGFHVGLLLVICGLAVNARWGWQENNVTVLPDETALTGPAATHPIQLPTGQNANGSITLSVKGGQLIRLASTSPACAGTFCYRLTNQSGPLVRLSAQDAAGARLALYEYISRPEAVEQLSFAFSRAALPAEQDRLFIVSDEKLVGRLRWENPQMSSESPRFHLWVFREGGQTLIGESDIDSNQKIADVTWENVTFNVEILRYAVLDISYYPGMWIIVSGVMLLLVGIVTTFIPRQTVWASVISPSDNSLVRIRKQTRGRSRPFDQRYQAALEELRAKIEVQ